MILPNGQTMNGRIYLWFEPYSPFLLSNFLTDDDIAYMAEYKWGLNIEANVTALCDPSMCQKHIDLVNAVHDVDASVPIFFQIEQPFGYSLTSHYPGAVVTDSNPNHYPTHTGSDGVVYEDPWMLNGGGTSSVSPSTIANYYARFGYYPQLWQSSNHVGETPTSVYAARFDASLGLMNECDALTGLGWEQGFDVGVAWLRNNTSKLLVQYLHGVDIVDNPLYPWPYWPQYGYTVASRLANVDMVMCENYYITHPSPAGTTSDALIVMQYLLANYPDIPVGYTTTYDALNRYWNVNPGDPLSYQQRKIANSIEYVKTKPFDFAESTFSGYGGMQFAPNVQDIIDFFNELQWGFHTTTSQALTNIAYPT
jgi:hypothetical protein